MIGQSPKEEYVLDNMLLDSNENIVMNDSVSFLVIPLLRIAPK